MFRRSTLICALLFSAPILWQAAVGGTVSVETAAIRFLIALPIAAVLLALVRAAARNRDEHPPGPPDAPR